LGPDFEKPPGRGFENPPGFGFENPPVRGLDAPPGLKGLLDGRAPPALGLPLLVVKGRAMPPSPRGELGLLDPSAPPRPGPLGRPEPARSNRGFSNPDLSNRGFSNRGFAGPDLSNLAPSDRGFSNPRFLNSGLPKLGLSVRGRSKLGRPTPDRTGGLLKVLGARAS
jgi:hypothetical protein